MTASLTELRSQLQQLAARHRAGDIDEAQYTQLRAPLERALADLVLAEGSQTAPIAAARPSRGLLATLSVGVLVLAAAGYAWKGSPGLKPVPVAAAAPADGDDQAARQQIEGMVGQIVERLKTKPDDAVGWHMLGRAYTVLGRLDEALPAYEKSIALRGTDATTLADYAEVLTSKNGDHPTPQADAMLARALSAEPTNLKALALAGTFAFERADYATAVRHWERMGQLLPPDSPDAPRLQASLAEARQRGGIAAPKLAMTAPSTSASTPPRASASASGAVAANSVSGTVTLAPALAAKASPTDTVFIFARAAQGPRMPLAVFRAQVKDLPITYKLDDSMAMAPNARISGAAQVIVGARISKSGNAIAQPGDLAGESAPVTPGASGVAITISTTTGS